MRTLNDIIPPSRRKEMGVPPVPPSRESAPLSPSRPPKFPYLMLTVVLLIIVASVGALFYFSSARIDITPTTVSAAVQGTHTAELSSGTLPFEIITAQKIASQSVKGNGSKAVSSPASGLITIYNTQSKAQALVATTRFATASGLIFRIRTAVTVPAGSTEKPGTVTARVYADKPGPAYNVGPTSFTIPGFSGTPQAQQVYARSTSAMTGGAEGMVPVVEAPVEASTRTILRSALVPDLEASVRSQIPEGYVLLPGAATTTFEALTSSASGTTSMVDVKEQGTITAVVFPNAALAKAIATSLTGFSYQGEPVTLALPADLRLTSTETPNSALTSFPFSISGNASLIYTVDESRIAAAVAGKSIEAARVAISNYPEVKNALLKLRPFWRRAFPQDPSSIEVVVANP